MASSDSTGYHVHGWQFHQYSSSGSVMKGTSECVMELDSGALIEGVMTLGTTAVLRQTRQSVIDSSSGVLVEGFNVLTLSSDPAFARLPVPAVGTKINVVVQGNSSNLYRILTSSSSIQINGASSAMGVAGDSDARGAHTGFGITFEATGAASYRVTHCPSSSIAISTAIV